MLDGLIVASPANPTGTMISAADLARLPLIAATANPADFGRDLPRDHLRSCGSDGAFLWARGDHHQLVLEVLQHDGMAAWLDVGAAGPRPLGRVPGSEFLHFPAGALAIAALPVFGCRAELDGHVGRYRTNRDLLIGAARCRRAHPLHTGRRSILPLRRYFESDTGQRGILPAAPRRDWGRRNPRSRFRSGQWRRLGALLLCRIDRKRRRGGAPSKGLAGSKTPK